jgi:hypothetical protein
MVINKRQLVLTETESVTTHAKRFDGRDPSPETTTTSKTTILSTESEGLTDATNQLAICEKDCCEPNFVFYKETTDDGRKISTGTSTTTEKVANSEDYKIVTKTITLMENEDSDSAPG